MKIYKPFEDSVPHNGVATLGFFDGVHKGHSSILSKVKSEAERYHTVPLVITLWPHPRVVLNKNIDKLFLLNTLEEKTSLIAKNGLEHFVVIPFDLEMANLSAEDFFRKYFVDWLKIKKLIVGYDHRIGKNGSGDYATMKALGEKYNIDVEKVEALSENGISISSTKVRNSLLEGNVKQASELLGYQYFISGTVVSGKKLGRSIGFPTANIKITDSHKLIPADGVYAAIATVDGFQYKGMINIGYRPTVSNENYKTIEINLFDFNGTIYGSPITVRFIDKLRNELKFDNVESLKEQLTLDKEKALLLLRNF